MTSSEQVNQYVSLLKSESKPAPFSTLFNKNSGNIGILSRQNSVELLSVKASQGDSKHTHGSKTLHSKQFPEDAGFKFVFPGKENSLLKTSSVIEPTTLARFELPRSPRRLSHITEKSADERLTLRKSRRSKPHSNRRSSSHFIEQSGRAACYESPNRRSSSLTGSLERSKSCDKAVLLVENNDKLSDIAQLGTPHPFESLHMMLHKCSQSSISLAEWVSDVASAADLVQCF